MESGTYLDLFCVSERTPGGTVVGPFSHLSGQ